MKKLSRNSKDPKDMSHYELMDKKLDFPASYTLGALSLSLTLIFLGYLEIPMTIMIGVILPIYWSAKAVEAPETDDDKQWLSYWAVFFTTLPFDLLFGQYLQLVPFFYLMKSVFLIWLYMPSTRGALILHNKFLEKVFGSFEMTKVMNTAEQFSHKVKETTEKYVHIPEVEKEEEPIKDKIDSEKIENGNSLASKTSTVSNDLESSKVRGLLHSPQLQRTRSIVTEGPAAVKCEIENLKEKFANKSKAYMERIAKVENKENQTINVDNVNLAS